MLTTSVSDVFQSHHEVMDALRQNFAGSDDAQRAVVVDKLREGTAAACQQREDDVKATIQGRGTALFVAEHQAPQHVWACRAVSAGARDPRGSNCQGGS